MTIDPELIKTVLETWKGKVTDQKMEPLLYQMTAIHACSSSNNTSYPDWIISSPALRWATMEAIEGGPYQSIAKKQECWTNCLLTSSIDSGLLYVEGWASSGLLSVPHAWLEDKETGKIFDPTWSMTYTPGNNNYLYLKK